MEKCPRIENPQLPEAMIQHIQSYLSRKEAARTTVLSKSWHSAWLTRPTLVFDPNAFEEFAVKTVQRYQHLNLKIEGFTLHMQSFRSANFGPLACKLTVDALKLGATQLNLELRAFVPEEVLNSKTLLRLSIKECEIDGSLDKVFFMKDDMISNIISCGVSIEELSLSNLTSSMCRKLGLSGKNQYELRKLKRLYLEMVNVDDSFFENFGPRFPCLNDLSLVHCNGYKEIRISSASLRRISLVQSRALRAELDVPNLAKFSYSGKSIPSLSIEAMEWESSISITCNRFHTYIWYIRLLRMLTKLSQSRIYLSLSYAFDLCWNTPDNEKDFELSSRPVVVENLTIEAPVSSSHDQFLAGLFWICHPKFLTLYWLPRDSCEHWVENNKSLNHVCKHMSREKMSIHDRDRSMFGRFDIEEASVEVYEEVLTEWKPL